MVLANLALILGSIAMALHFYFVLKNSDYALASVAAGILLVVLFVMTWPSPTPLVILNDMGILDRRSGIGIIRWEDIQEIQVEVVGPFLCLRLRNPEVYIARMPTHRRYKLKFHQNLGFKMLNISLKGLNANALFLLEHSRKMISERRPLR